MSPIETGAFLGDEFLRFPGLRMLKVGGETFSILDILVFLPYSSGQIIPRPHTTDFPQKVAFWKGNPQLFQGNLGWSGTCLLQARSHVW